jgi:Tfp pilus assembly protein PilO
MAAKTQAKTLKFDPKVLIVAVLGAAALVAAVLSFHRPATASLEEARVTFEQESVRLEQLQAKDRTARERGQNYLAGLYEEAVSIVDLLPTASAQSEARLLFNSLASRYGVTLSEVATDGARKSDSAARLDYDEFTITVSGSLAQLLGWVEDVNAQPRLYTFTTFSLSRSGDTYQLKTTVRAWSLPENAVPAQMRTRTANPTQQPEPTPGDATAPTEETGDDQDVEQDDAEGATEDGDA